MESKQTKNANYSSRYSFESVVLEYETQKDEGPFISFSG